MKLNKEDIQKNLEHTPHWSLNEKGEITRLVEVKDFLHSLTLVQTVGFFAEKAGHHPDIVIQYNKVKFNLITHDAGGLTDKDFALAAKINSLV